MLRLTVQTASPLGLPRPRDGKHGPPGPPGGTVEFILLPEVLGEIGPRWLVAEDQEVLMSHALSAVSFRDPAGFVYAQHGDLRRQVNLVYREHYDRLMDRALRRAGGSRLLIPHEELSCRPGNRAWPTR